MLGQERVPNSGGRQHTGRGRGVFPLLPARGLLERRRVVLAAACLAYAGVFGLRLATADPADALSLLYVAPVALFALELGFVIGLCAALGATALTVMWWASARSGLDPVAILTWTAAFVAVGGIAGWFSDRMRAAQHRQRLLLQSGLTLTRLGKEEGLAAALAQQAGSLLEADDVRVEQVGAAPASGPAARDERRVPLQVGGSRYGTLVFRRSRPLTADDQMAVSILALQASVAAENARLLVSEHERAAQLRELIDRVEIERTHVAYELHEQAAQMLAGVLLRLAALDRQLDAEIAGMSLEQLRSDIGSTMRSLRALAVEVKPSALDLGLTAALQELVCARPDDASSTVAISGADDLDPETSLLVYRAVEEALRAVPVAESLMLRTGASGRELAIEIHAPRDAIESGGLAILRARVDLLGGELDASERRLGIVLPLRRSGEPASHSSAPDPAQGGEGPAPRPGSTRAPVPSPEPA